MKKLIALCLLWLCSLSLFACNAVENEKQENLLYGDYFFDAIVLGENDDYIVVRCYGLGYGEVTAGEIVTVSKNVLNESSVKDWTVDDKIRVFYYKPEDGDYTRLDNVKSICCIED